MSPETSSYCSCYFCCVNKRVCVRGGGTLLLLAGSPENERFRSRENVFFRQCERCHGGFLGLVRGGFPPFWKPSAGSGISGALPSSA